MKYFSYGMNTNGEQMAQRCPQARCLGSATLLDHEFRFAGHADVVPDPGNQVEGVLWEITPACLDALDRLEGFPDYYLRDIVRVVWQGKLELAMTYYMTGDRADQLPTDSYVAMLREGYTEHGVPEQQIDMALDFARQNISNYINTDWEWYYDKV